MTSILKLGVTVYLISLFLYRFIEINCIKNLFIDSPDDDRKIHERPVPRHGGLVFGALTLGFVGYFDFFEPILWIGIGGGIIVAIGFIDDLYQLPWRVKAPVQLGVGIWLALTHFPQIHTINLFGLGLPNQSFVMGGLFIIWFLGITNAINLIDGMDGLAGGVSSLMLVSVTFLSVKSGVIEGVFLLVIVLSSLLVFLKYNSKPAQLFMGDTGSLFLGYLLAVIPFIFIETKSEIITLDITPFILIYSYVIVDTLRVMWVRYKNNKSPMKPGKEHLHHLLIASTNSYNGTLFIIFLLVAMSSILGLLI